MAVHAIILSGGHGARLWPASRPSRPKQFLPLLGETSLFQAAVLRMEQAVGPQPPIVVAGERHAEEIERQLQALGGRQAILLIEPAARDSGPAIAVAAAWIARHDPEGVGAMVASDHHMPDVAAFAAATAHAVAVARQGYITTFGVRPAEASTAYGYIRVGAPLGEGPARAVERFAEKPDAATARRYLEEGWLWNSGNFVFSARTLLDELDRHAPELAQAARRAVEASSAAPGRCRLGEAFLNAPKISIDYALMEKTDRAAVMPLDTAWSDLGAWDAVHAALPHDGDDNVAPPDAVLHDSRGCLIRCATDQRVATAGLRDVAVIVERDAILVASLSASQSIKQVAERAAAALVSTPAPEARLRAQAGEWMGWLFGAALPLWCTVGADRDQGAFQEAIGLDLNPTSGARRLRVQARQTFVYAMAGEMGWRGPWREAVALGLSSLRRFHRRAEGGYRTLVGTDGAVLDDAVMLYDQAFVLLALAWAQRTGVEPAAEAEALSLLDQAIEPRRNAEGGFREADEARPWQSNPHMHLLEAALAWRKVGTSPRWAALSDEIAALCLSHFIDPSTGAVGEFFDAQWARAPGADGAVVEPGHQFEWAWLLDRWSEAADAPKGAEAAERLYAVGAGSGVDPERGVAIDSLDAHLRPAATTARLWPQTERMKAALRLARGEGRRERLADAADATDGLARYIDGITPGLWRDRMTADGGFVAQPAPASSLYHIICAVAELSGAARGLR